MKKVIIGAALVLVALIGGYIVAGKVWGFPILTTGHANEGTEKTVVYSMGQFVTNLLDPCRFVRVTLDLKVLDIPQNEQLTEKMSELRTDIYALLRSKTYAELVGEEGLRDLQQHILDRINLKCPDIVQNVFFSEFIIQ